MRDQLRDHRVVGEADLVALLDPGVDANGRLGLVTGGARSSRPGLREERPGVLGVQAHLDRVPSGLVTVCCKRLSVGDAELLGDEVEARDRLGHRVLDLDAAVQLEEEEVVAVEDELDRAGAAVADRPAEGDRRLVERRAQRGREAGRGRLLEHLLMAPLDGAVALADRDDGSVRVGEQLHLDVARPLEVALAVERPVAEGAGRPRARRRRARPRARPRSARRASRARRRPRPP